jgi:hypothetical protein
MGRLVCVEMASIVVVQLVARGSNFCGWGDFFTLVFFLICLASARVRESREMFGLFILGWTSMFSLGCFSVIQFTRHQEMIFMLFNIGSSSKPHEIAFVLTVQVIFDSVFLFVLSTARSSLFLFFVLEHT